MQISCVNISSLKHFDKLFVISRNMQLFMCSLTTHILLRHLSKFVRLHQVVVRRHESYSISTFVHIYLHETKDDISLLLLGITVIPLGVISVKLFLLKKKRLCQLFCIHLCETQTWHNVTHLVPCKNILVSDVSI